MARSTKKVGGNFVAKERGLMGAKVTHVIFDDLHNARQGNEPGPIDYRGRQYPAGKSQLHRVSDTVVRRKTKKDIMVEAYGNMNHRDMSWHVPEGFKVAQAPNIVHAVDSAVGNGLSIWFKLNK